MSAEESAERIYAMLTQARSPDTATRQQAEHALRAAEEQQDFFSSLVMITTAPDTAAPPPQRWLAAVVAKNAIRRSWRRRMHHNAVTDDERLFVIRTLLDALGERSSMVATQTSVWLALVARIDFPAHCPTLLADLCEALRARDWGVVLHAATTLDMVLKQLASRRLASDRRALGRATPEVFAILYELFVRNVGVLRGGGREEELETAFRVVERCLKSFKKLLSYGCERMTDLEQVPRVFSKLLEVPDLFMRGATGGNEVQLRLSLLAAKLVRITQERHPVDFQVFLPAFIEVYFKTVVAFDYKISGARICYQATEFLKNVVQCPAYAAANSNMPNGQQLSQPNGGHGESPSPTACRDIVTSFFDESKVNALVETMVSKIFVLNDQELETWSTDPEGLVREEEAAEWGTENLRHACEELFKIILIREKRRIVPMILQLTEAVPSDQPLLLDACYRAVGQAVYDVQGAFQFETWLNGRLGAILQAERGSNLGERIIQARAVWLVGQFAEQLTRESRQAVNPLLVRLMSLVDGDLVISLTAAKAIQTLVEDMGFHAGDFVPHLQTCLLSCFQLVCIAESLETMRDIMGTALSLLERFPSRYVVPHLDLITRSLPKLWDQGSSSASPRGSIAGVVHDGAIGDNVAGLSGEENLLRKSIVSILACVIKKTGAVALQSEQMRHFVFPVIEFAVDLSNGKGGTFMMEDGCDLWAAVIAASTDYTAELSKLYPLTDRILGVDFNNLREVFSIMDSYVLLGKEQFMQEYGSGMLCTLTRALDSTKDRGCLAAVDLLDLLLQLFPQQGAESMSGILQIALAKLSSGVESQIMGAAYAGLLSRACLSNMDAVERSVLLNDETHAVELLDGLLSHVDALYRLPRRKLAVVAICGLCARYARVEAVMGRVPLVLNALVQVLAEERQRGREGGRVASDFENMLARFGEEGDTHEIDARGGVGKEPSPEEQRRKELGEGDLVKRMDVKEACREVVAAIRGAGEERYSQAMHATDARVLQQLEELLRVA